MLSELFFAIETLFKFNIIMINDDDEGGERERKRTEERNKSLH